MKIPDTITAKVREFREKFVIEETSEEEYIKDNNATPLITFLEQALLDVRRETIEEACGLVKGTREANEALIARGLINICRETEQEVLKKGKKAWIQGNIISFEKPAYQSYQSAFFDLEEVTVLRSPKDPNTPTV